MLTQHRAKIDLMAIRADSRFDGLDDKTKQVITALFDTRNSLAHDIQIQTRAIAQMLSRTELAVLSQQDRTRAIIIETLRARDNFHQQSLSPTEQWKDNVARDFDNEEIKLKVTVEDAILESLMFPTMTDRMEEISDEHVHTFEWLFDENHLESWPSFVKWLREPGGLYWINGKAASGKSTLLRFIHRNPRTSDLLRSWASPHELQVAAFFFWNSGTLEQRSQLGFLKSLLHDVLNSRRDLISVVLPCLWAQIYSDRLRSPGHNTPIA
jgi:hypothetical protein